MSITVFLTYPPQTYDTEEDSFSYPRPPHQKETVTKRCQTHYMQKPYPTNTIICLSLRYNNTHL